MVPEILRLMIWVTRCWAVPNTVASNLPPDRTEEHRTSLVERADNLLAPARSPAAQIHNRVELALNPAGLTRNRVELRLSLAGTALSL